MADWRDELEMLLARLHVAFEGEPTPPAAHDAAQQPIHTATAPTPATSRPHIAERATDGVEDDEVSAVRTEMEATVSRMVALMRAGKVDRVLRDDVIYVLQALTRPQPQSLIGLGRADAQDWNLASAAAVLHFCRIVLRLTQPMAADLGE